MAERLPLTRCGFCSCRTLWVTLLGVPGHRRQPDAAHARLSDRLSHSRHAGKSHARPGPQGPAGARRGADSSDAQSDGHMMQPRVATSLPSGRVLPPLIQRLPGMPCDSSERHLTPSCPLTDEETEAQRAQPPAGEQTQQPPEKHMPVCDVREVALFFFCPNIKSFVAGFLIFYLE